MKVYIFLSEHNPKTKDIDLDGIRHVIDTVAHGTDTSDLVVSIYFNTKSLRNGGTALAQNWVMPHHFHPGRGTWRQFTHYPIPQDLPHRFKLIRLVMMTDHALYPLIQKDIYNWVHRYESFQDHLAHIFAHEMHHFRRYHLGFHEKEGEHSANLWATHHVRSLGYQVSSEKLSPARRSRKKKINLSCMINPADFPVSMMKTTWQNLFQTICQKYLKPHTKSYINSKLKHCQRLRTLQPGSLLMVHFDPHNRYSGKVVTLVRTLRKDSLRILVRTPDGKLWRWPMVWLKEQ
jgi:hypothetical protein